MCADSLRLRPIVWTLCVFLSLAKAQDASKPTAALQDRLGELMSRYGVTVVYRYTPESIPKAWRRPPASVVATQAAMEDCVIGVDACRTFLDSYAPPVVRSHLRTVFLLGSLEIRGKRCGATNSKDALFVTVNGLSSGRKSMRFVLARLHSEFSSILMRSRCFPDVEWSQANPKGWTYGEDAFDRVESPDAYAGTKDLREEGFLCTYSTTSLENDVNMFADWRFTRRQDLERLAAQHQRIARKLAILDGFYERVDEEAKAEVRIKRGGASGARGGATKRRDAEDESSGDGRDAAPDTSGAVAPRERPEADGS